MVKNLPTVRETWVQSLCQEDPLEKEMATCSSIFPWRIPWTEESSQPITLPSLGLCPGNFLSISLGPGTSKLADTNRIGLWPWGLSKDDSHVPRQLQSGAMGEAEDAAPNK